MDNRLQSKGIPNLKERSKITNEQKNLNTMINVQTKYFEAEMPSGSSREQPKELGLFDKPSGKLFAVKLYCRFTKSKPLQ